jgi:type I restriction enzyme, S subunit
MLPKGWKSYNLGEVASFKNGLNFTRSDAGNAVKIVGVSDFKDRAQLESTDQLAMIQIAGALRDDELLQTGDLLFVRSNGNKELIGRCLYFPQVQERLAFSGFTIRGRVNTTVLDPLFASYLMRSRSVLDQVFLGGSGTNISNLSQEILSNIAIQVPCLSEQRRIAQILFTLDQAISTSEGLLANAQRQMAGLLQQLLIKPTARGDWDTRPIGELSERIQRRANEGEELPVLMISSGSGFVRQEEKYSRFMAGKNVENYIALDRGEFAYNKGNSKSYEFGCVFPLNTCERGLVPNVYVCFKLSPNLNAVFYEHLFRADFLHDQLGALVNTGVRNNGLLNIKPVDFLACRVPVPPLDVQHRIAEVLTTTAKWVALQERDLELLKLEKAALMSQLLTGKRRVKLPGAETEVHA